MLNKPNNSVDFQPKHVRKLNFENWKDIQISYEFWWGSSSCFIKPKITLQFLKHQKTSPSILWASKMRIQRGFHQPQKYASWKKMKIPHHTNLTPELADIVLNSPEIKPETILMLFSDLIQSKFIQEKIMQSGTAEENNTDCPSTRTTRSSSKKKRSLQVITLNTQRSLRSTTIHLKTKMVNWRSPFTKVCFSSGVWFTRSTAFKQLQSFLIYPINQNISQHKLTKCIERIPQLKPFHTLHQMRRQFFWYIRVVSCYLIFLCINRQRFIC